MRVLLNGAEQRLSQGYDVVICGHYHRLLHQEMEGGALVVLGDWMTHDSYAVLDENGLSLRTYPNGAVVEPQVGSEER